MNHSRSGKPLWCYWHYHASDEADPVCTAQLADGLALVCPYADYADSQAQKYHCVDAEIVRRGNLVGVGGVIAVHPCDAATGVDPALFTDGPPVILSEHLDRADAIYEEGREMMRVANARDAAAGVTPELLTDGD
jgi:hypothetical protein